MTDNDPESDRFEDGPTCPTPTAHKRLDEGHRWWHGCLDNYDSPADFQASLNACLQALRNVTWVLQKEKRLIDDFDEWYPAWQAVMKADPLMAWLVKSRNRVVKAGDLELHSTAHLRIIHDYNDLAGAMTDSLPDVVDDGERVKHIAPSTRPPEYVRYLQGIPERALDNIVLLVERRWVDKALPDRELLDALAHCYGVLAQILGDAHDRKKLVFSIEKTDALEDEQLNDEGDYRGRLPCMVTTLDARTTTYRTTDGSLVSGEMKVRRYGVDRDMARRVARYGSDKLGPDLAQRDLKSALDFVDPFYEQAKRLLIKDKYHTSMTFLFIGPRVVFQSQVLVEDRAGKYEFAQILAKQAILSGADGVLTIAEFWQSGVTFDEDGVLIPPADASDREEGLAVHAEIRSGEYRNRWLYFHKRFGRVRIDREDETREGYEYNLLEPLRAAWAARD